MKRYMLTILALALVTAGVAAYAAHEPLAQGEDAIQRCFGHITDITQITLDDLLGCVEILKEIGDRILEWILQLIRDFKEHFFPDAP